MYHVWEGRVFSGSATTRPQAGAAEAQPNFWVSFYL